MHMTLWLWIEDRRYDVVMSFTYFRSFPPFSFRTCSVVVVCLTSGFGMQYAQVRLTPCSFPE